MLFPLAADDDDEDGGARDDEAFKLFAALVERISDRLCKKLGKGIVVDSLVLRECFISAQQSITFHGKGEGSYLKQAAHCCFWISKLKPLTLSVGASELVGRLVVTTKSSVLRRPVKVDMAPAIEQAVQARVIDGSLIFPLNETCGIHVGHHMAIVGLKQLGDRARHSNENEKAESIQADIKRHNARFGEASKRLVRSLRFNNHSARATAVMFEWLYDRPEDKKADND